MVIDAQIGVFSRVWYRGCVLAFQANEANSSFATRSNNLRQVFASLMEAILGPVYIQPPRIRPVQSFMP